MSSSTSMLTPSQKYAAGGLFALALHQTQIHQTLRPGFPSDTAAADGNALQKRATSSDPLSKDSQRWTHPTSGLLRPIFKFLEIDSKEWAGLEETAAASPTENHVGAFLRLLMKESSDMASEVADRKASHGEAAEKEAALTNGVDAMSSNMETTPSEYDSKREKRREYENACREKFPTPEAVSESKSEGNSIPGSDNSQQGINNIPSSNIEQAHRQSILESHGKPMEDAKAVSYQRKVTVLHELLSACLADNPEDSKKRKGYDSRHRVALRLLSIWFDIKWIKVEAIETVLACSAMTILKEEESKEEGESSEKSWAKWKKGGIIGTAALTGGTLMAITGGLAAPAIAASFGALAPTLGTVIPVIGASGFATVASAAGSVAGSVAVAASFGAAGAGLTGTKMARRIGDVDEFEFKAIGENHNQGRLAVGISISGFVFEKEDFIRPWEGQQNNLERYILQWESKHLIAISTAIQDWLTSKIASEMMKRGAMMTVLHSLMIALAWPTTLLSLTSFIDSIWTIAVDRTDKAGKLLAEVLLKGLPGYRPVTLVGFSLGARVIFRCLEILAENDNNAGIVERVVLLGAPVPIKGVNWEATRKVVAGRYVNVYSTDDWMLGIAFRANLLTEGLAGIQPVNVPGIENVDVTEIIEGHSSYLWGTQDILEQLQLDTYYPVFNQQAAKEYIYLHFG